MVKKKGGVLKVIDLNYALLILLALILGCKETPIIIDKDSTIQIASISSSILDMDVNYSVYLPSSYESDGPFPVLYLLHGHYGNHGFHNHDNFYSNNINNNNTNINNNTSSSSSSNSTGHCVVIVANGDRSFFTHLGCMEHFEANNVNIESVINNITNNNVGF